MSKHGAIPTLAYRNADKAIEFLVKALGFEAKNVYRDDDGHVMHAELQFGEAFIMLGTAENKSDFGQLTRIPEEVGGHNTQSPYFIVEEIDNHYKNAVTHNAKIVMPIKDEDYGGRGYSCKDPEGYIWNFGTYSPYS
ncbi:VOC family protein [Allomuricauda sp. d1]|uniref:VOC family protein n=1 Tax=Allomuricauda sp. d1 TaxID=3136725 RepID=UPI0031D74E6C